MISVRHKPLQYLSCLFVFFFSASRSQFLPSSCLENPRDGGAWWAAVYGVAQGDLAEAAAVVIICSLPLRLRMKYLFS